MDCLNDLKLAATPLHARLDRARDGEPFVARLTTHLNEPVPSHCALLVSKSVAEIPTGFAAYFCTERDLTWPEAYLLPPELCYLEEGDILRIDPRQAHVWVMYRRSSRFNSLLLTERCNSWCVMCSQPPKAKDDDLLVRAWLDAIRLMSPDTQELGFTGGEPTLLGDSFLDLVATCRDYLPATGVHVLSNGRLFNYLKFAQKLAAIGHPDLVIGIPLYSDVAWQHDFIVQAEQAFDQTIRGILNLARCGVRIELRVVLHRYSIERLPRLAEFVARNLPFVDHVAIMGLEPIGFAKSNLHALWVDPADYHAQLDTAVLTLANHAINVSIYNHQLCVLPRHLWPFSRQSISDWKNIYLPQCEHCSVREKCGGFFHSAAKAHSRAIHPLPPEPIVA